MPNSQDVANAFASGAREVVEQGAWSSDVDVCYPQNAKVPGYDLSGGHKQEPAGVDYNVKPEVKNPRSVDGQLSVDGLKYDAQGK